MKMRGVLCLPTAGFTSSNEQTMALMRFWSSIRPAASDVDEDAEEIPAQSALVPADSVAGRSLVIVIAIMTFLAALAANVAILVADASVEWRSDVAREATVQVRPVPGRNVEADVKEAAEAMRRTPGVREARGLRQVGIRSAADAVARRGSGSLRTAHAPHDRAEARRRKSGGFRQAAHGARARRS